VSLDATDFEQAVEKYHLALDDFMKGNPAPAKELFFPTRRCNTGQPLWSFRAWMEAGRSDDREGGISLQGRRCYRLREHSEVCDV
jgi:hypothetical protein